MAWDGSDRSARLPADWSRRRAFVLARAGFRCEAQLHDTGLRCEAVATDCDHVSRGDDHDVANLQALCSWHHKRKTHQEAMAELERVRRRREPPARHHPGELPD